MGAIKKYTYNKKTGGYFGCYTEKVKIKVEKKRYRLLEQIIDLFFEFAAEEKPYLNKNNPKHPISEYKIIEGDYQNYNIRKSNCAVFVYDCLTIISDKPIKFYYKSTKFIPYSVYKLAQKMGKENKL